MSLGIAEGLRVAAAHLNGGKLVVADFICRDILAADPGNVAATNLLGVVAERLGLRARAIDYFRASLARDPNYQPAKDNHRRITNLPASKVRPHAIQGRRYLLIKAWGAGFWSDIGHVLGSLLLADITGRIPVTHWGRNSLFGDDSGRDAFQFYFEPVSPVALDALVALHGADFFPSKWSVANLDRDDQAKWNGPGSRMAAIQYLSRPETVAITDFYIGVIDLMPWIPKSHRLFGKTLVEVYRALAARYLRPRQEIAAAVEAFYSEHLSGAPVTAVHVRGTDKQGEMRDIDRLNGQYFDRLDRQDPASRIFLLTDDLRWSEAFRARYGNRVVVTDSQRSAGHTGTHYLPTADHVRLGFEVMIDTYLALRCARFIGNGGSNVSAFVAALKPWGNEECTLLAPSLLHARNLYIHTMSRS